MQTFIQEVRAYEGFLSKAQITNAKDLVKGTHNYVAHMIARVNEEYGITGSRMARNAMWFYMMKDLHSVIIGAPEIQPEIQGVHMFHVPQNFRPACATN